MTDLLFSQPPSSNTNLVFGEATGGGLPPLAEFSIVGTLPGLSFAALVKTITKFSLTGTFDNTLNAVMEVTYFTNTQRPTVAQVLTVAQLAAQVEWGISQPQQHASPNNSGTQAIVQDAAPASAALGAVFAQANPATVIQRAAFQDALAVHDATTGRMQEGERQWLKFFSQFQEADRFAADRVRGVMQDGIRTRAAPIEQPFQDARKRAAVSYTGRAAYAQAMRAARYSPFQEARVPPVGRYVRPVVPPVTPTYWGTDLLFQCPPLAAPNLLFGLYPCTGVDPSVPAFFQILPARFYMTAHTIYAQTLPDLVDVPIFEATVAADSGSYCWSLSASGPASLFEQLAPVGGLPAQIKLTLDGIPWVFAVDSLARTQAFGQTGVRVSGRSVTALIASPYLRSTTRNNATDQTAQQLAMDALAGTGVALNWGVGEGALSNGGMIDWLVPAGAWSHQGTPLDAVQAIVQSAGGYLQSHRSAATLQARHPYGQRVGDAPGAPWGWGTGAADVELALDALITEGVQRKDGAAINAVYVSGTNAGVLALVKRAGTAGDALSAMVTDPLITHTSAARQRGLSVLGAAGHKYAVSLDLPVLTGAGQPGVLEVGQLVQVNASAPWRARVRSVSVQAKQPTLRQSVTLERHLEAA